MTKKTNKADSAKESPSTDVQARVDRIKRYIGEMLRSAGLDTSTAGYQMEELARDLLSYRKVSDEFLSLGETTISEKSREGDERLRAHPLGFEVRQWSDTVRKDLAKLVMNLKDSDGRKPQQDDAFDALMKKLKDGDD